MGRGVALACLAVGWLPACAAPELVEAEAAVPVAMAMPYLVGEPKGPEPQPDPEPEPDPPLPPHYSIHVGKIAVAQAEDGAGKTVPAVDPRSLELHGPLFPVRALDPVLYIGELHFHHYTYPAKGVLRYAVADVALLPEGAEVYVQWGDDEASRIDITRSFEIPKSSEKPE